MYFTLFLPRTRQMVHLSKILMVIIIYAGLYCAEKYTPMYHVATWFYSRALLFKVVTVGSDTTDFDGIEIPSEITGNIGYKLEGLSDGTDSVGVVSVMLEALVSCLVVNDFNFMRSCILVKYPCFLI